MRNADQPSFDELRELLGVDRTPDEENPYMLGAVRSYEAWAERLVEERDEWLPRAVWPPPGGHEVTS